MSAPTITWWGCATVELRAEGGALVVDPYLNPAAADYVCVTHADYDHCHEPTLRRLVEREEFKLLCVPPSCLDLTKLDVPHNENPADLAFVPEDRLLVLYPKFRRDPDAVYPGAGQVELGPFSVETIDSSERPQRYKPDDATPWPAATGAFLREPYPNLGYLITHRPTGLTFLHPGDLTEAFDAQRELRGRVDYLFFPGVKLEGIELTVVDNLRPRFVVPIHHRIDEPGFPIPLDVEPETFDAADPKTGMPQPGADPAAFRREIHRLMQGHWYPTPDPPLERLQSLEPQFEQLGARLLVLDAGRPLCVA